MSGIFGNWWGDPDKRTHHHPRLVCVKEAKPIQVDGSAENVAKLLLRDQRDQDLTHKIPEYFRWMREGSLEYDMSWPKVISSNARSENKPLSDAAYIGM